MPGIWLAREPEAATINGRYFGPPHNEEPVKAEANDIAAQDRLWAVSAETAGLGEKITI
jgi:hypothetical protein